VIRTCTEEVNGTTLNLKYRAGGRLTSTTKGKDGGWKKRNKGRQETSKLLFMGFWGPGKAIHLSLTRYSAIGRGGGKKKTKLHNRGSRGGREDNIHPPPLRQGAKKTIPINAEIGPYLELEPEGSSKAEE